jgi:hypothetical protein
MITIITLRIRRVKSLAGGEVVAVTSSYLVVSGGMGRWGLYVLYGFDYLR